MGETEQGETDHRHQTTGQQYAAPPEAIREPAAVETDQGREGHRATQQQADEGGREGILPIEQNGEEGPHHVVAGTHHEGAQNDDPDQRGKLPEGAP